MQHTKEKGKNPQDQTDEEEIGSLPEKEFRVMIVKMIINLRNKMEKIQETFNPRRAKEQTNSDEQQNNCN